MQTIRIYFTRRNWNPVSVGIRAAVPDSFCRLAEASHCLIEDGDCMIEASMLYGVRRVPTVVALHGCTVVKVVEYAVPDAERGLAFGRAQICRYVPPELAWMPPRARSAVQSALKIVNSNYDWSGVFGMGIASDRDWQDPSRWFCFELAAAILANAGLDIFESTGRISGHFLMQIRPKLQYQLNVA
jgi:hypothetical protein